jgi:hypothetical protein
MGTLLQGDEESMKIGALLERQARHRRGLIAVGIGYGRAAPRRSTERDNAPVAGTSSGIPRHHRVARNLS